MLPEKPINVLVVGGGGREHALCWKLSQSAYLDRLYCAPGNGGTANLANAENVDIAPMNFKALADFCHDKAIELVVVGPDNPLAEGIVDTLESRGLRVFGPTREQARLEWSKAFAKEFMIDCGVPTARFLVCDSFAEGKKLIKANPWARVVKADGLALGKGVFVCDGEDETIAALRCILEERRFGEAGDRVVIEEKLHGEELSLIALCDGKRLLPLAPCQDHKRRFDSDSGPNTGGMGAYSPVPLYDRCRRKIEEQVVRPLERALQTGRLTYKGALYIGLMVAGAPGSGGNHQEEELCVLEFNARFGDPETQALLPRMTTDLLPAVWACTEGSLDQVAVEWSAEASCCVVAVAASYPEGSSRGEPIQISKLPERTVIFHAGTRIDKGRLETCGGRVLAITALGPSIGAAAASAYEGIKAVSFAGMSYRTDIARRATSQCLSS